jgi:hypothetical protein
VDITLRENRRAVRTDTHPASTPYRAIMHLLRRDADFVTRT